MSNISLLDVRRPLANGAPLILGGESATALGLARCIGRSGPKPVVISTGVGGVSAKSRFVAASAVHPLNSILAEFLSNLSVRPGTHIFAATDGAARFLDTNASALAGKWSFAASSRYRLAELHDKRFSQRLARQAGFRVPNWTSSQDANSESVLDLNFPVIVKPVDSASSSNNCMRITDCPIDAISYATEISDAVGETIIQEYIDTTDSAVLLEVFAYFFDREVNFVVTEKQRIFPRRTGSTSASVSIECPQLKPLLLNFMKETGFRGLVDIELFRKESAFIFVECNFRAGTPVAITAEAGLNLPLQVVTGSTGKSSYSAGVRYVREYSELGCYRKRDQPGFGLVALVCSLLTADCRLLFQVYDPLPFFYSVLKKYASVLRHD